MDLYQKYKNIRIISILYSFCLRPLHKPLLKGISMDHPKYNQKDIINNIIYSSRISKVLLDKYKNQVAQRIEKYCDKIFIDEVQDFAGDDYDFLLFIASLNVELLLVGDYYQGTYKSSTRGNKNIKIRNDEDFYFNQFEKFGYKVDRTTLHKSYRCSKNVCDFIRNTLHINIESTENNNGNLYEITDLDTVKKIILNNNIAKLYYSKASTHLGNVNNWGNSKGMTYNEVCVVLNKKQIIFIKNKLHELAKESKAKFYVACTRSKGNVYLVDINLINKAEEELKNQ